MTTRSNIYLPWLEVTAEQVSSGMVAGAVGAEAAHKLMEEWISEGLELNGEI